MDFLHQRKDLWHQDHSSRPRQFGGGRKPSEIWAQARSPGSQAALASWQAESPPSLDQLTEMPRKVAPAAAVCHRPRTPWVGFPGATPFSRSLCHYGQARFKLDVLWQLCRTRIQASGESAGTSGGPPTQFHSESQGWAKSLQL